MINILVLEMTHFEKRTSLVEQNKKKLKFRALVLKVYDNLQLYVTEATVLIMS